jgi:predicted DNA-binding transcriptional regulator YafY
MSKACRNSEVISVEYVPLAKPIPETRLIAPHTLIYTGMRWHVRAYCEKNRMYRDFVLSPLRGEPEYEQKTEHLVDATNPGTPKSPLSSNRLTQIASKLATTAFGQNQKGSGARYTKQ